MMGGRWIEDNGAADQAACTLANGVWNLQFARCEQCAKQETLCAWLTDDPVTDGYQQCWDPINNKCSFPTIGAPTYNNMPWSDCGGANGATRTRIQRCIKGNCEGLCSGVIGTYPFDQIADTRSGGTVQVALVVLELTLAWALYLDRFLTILLIKEIALVQTGVIQPIQMIPLIRLEFPL
jgi:hypothetical protein